MKRRFLALALGLLATFVLLELGIRVAYSGFVRAQEQANLADIARGDQVVRIACVGESTTAVAGDPEGRRLVTSTAYPAQLERILNERSPQRRFEVINLGSMSGTTSVTLEQLEDSIAQQPPHMVIAMMGIKDTPNERLPGLASLPGWVASLRSAQLMAWLVEDLRLRRDQVAPDLTEVDAIPEPMQQMSHELKSYVKEPRLLDAPPAAFKPALDDYRIGLYLWYIGRLADAEQHFREMIEERDLGYSALARVLTSAGRIAEAEELLDHASALHPREASYQVTLAELLTEDGRPDEAIPRLEAALERVDSYARPQLAKAHLRLALGDALRARGDASLAEPILLAVTATDHRHGLGKIAWPTDYLRDIALGKLYLGMDELALAEQHLLAALKRAPKRHVTMFMLGQVYARTGEFDKEEALRREILGDTDRLAEYFELAKMYRRAGHPDRAPELVATAVERIPSLERNYRQLYGLGQRHGIQLLVMQYPGFGLDLLHRYAPPTSTVTFIDNEHLFDADPERYWFSPRFPNSFSHYTDQGAELLAEHVADAVLASLERTGADEAP
jgi:tetratricopeptide (TPR) repeat protein